MRSHQLAVLWTLHSGRRTIEYVAGTHPPSGLELWVTVNGHLVRRQPFGCEAELLNHASKCRAHLERNGWALGTPETESTH